MFTRRGFDPFCYNSIKTGKGVNAGIAPFISSTLGTQALTKVLWIQFAFLEVVNSGISKTKSVACPMRYKTGKVPL
jgi:hypothetical protein